MRTHSICFGGETRKNITCSTFLLKKVLYLELCASLGGSIGYASDCDQEMAGAVLTGSGNILLWRLIMKYFLLSFSPFTDSRRAVVSFWQKNVHKYWLTA